MRFWLNEESELVAPAREVFNCEYVPPRRLTPYGAATSISTKTSRQQRLLNGSGNGKSANTTSANNADAIYSHSKTYSTMETQQQINELQSRQLELRAIMASSDERAAKCFKNGTSFRETYPDDFARYEAANAEYNRNEQTLAKLEATREAERAEEEQAHNIDAV